MHTLEILAVLVLMLANSMLVTMMRARSAIYRQHFAMASHELNPMRGDSAENVRRSNLVHGAAIVALTLLFLIADRWLMPAPIFEFLLGAVFAALGLLCSRHMSNLLVFRYVAQHPQQLSGRVELSQQYGLFASLASFISIAPFLALVTLLSPNAYTVGIVAGALVLIGVHFIWLAKTPSQDPD